MSLAKFASRMALKQGAKRLQTAPLPMSQPSTGAPRLSAPPDGSDSQSTPIAAVALPWSVLLTGHAFFTETGDRPANVTSDHMRDLTETAAQVALPKEPDASAGEAAVAAGDVEIRLVWFVGTDGLRDVFDEVEEHDDSRSLVVNPHRWSRSSSNHHRYFTASTASLRQSHEGRRFDRDGLRGTFGEVAERFHTLDGFSLFNQQALSENLRNMPYAAFETFVHVKLPDAVLERCTPRTPSVVAVPLQGFADVVPSVTKDLTFGTVTEQRALSGTLLSMVSNLARAQATMDSRHRHAAVLTTHPRNLRTPRYHIDAAYWRGGRDDVAIAASSALPKTNRR